MSQVLQASRQQSTTGAIPEGMESFKYDDAIVRKFLVMMYVWSLVAFLVGLIAAIELVLPQVRDAAAAAGYAGIANALNYFLGIPYFTFGRIRPLHTNAAIFAFAGNAIFAAIYYSTQRLCKTRMWSDKLSALHFWGWQLIILCAALTLPFGITQGKEYAELEWPIDLMIAVVWLVFFGGNFFMTLINRRERHMYVALWFYIATIVTVTVLHVFNNIWVPVIGASGSGGMLIKSYPIYAGVQDAFMQWWYGHNAVAFFLTTPFLGLMYYFLPKAAERPVFSYRLSIIHFWSLVFIYIWAGPHHLHYTSLPDWASTLGMVFSVMLWMPSWGGMINGLLTLRGAWHKLATDTVLKFFVVGITFYGMSTFEGPLLSIKAVNSLSHYTDWTIAHVHSGALGWNGLMSFGMMYWLLPRLFQTKLFSEKLAAAHFWLATVGILLYIVPIYVAGITQGLLWRALTPEGQLASPNFTETVLAILPEYYLRIIGGVMYMSGAVLGGINFYKTWAARPSQYVEPVYHAPALTRGYAHDPKKPKSKLDNVADVAKTLDVFSTMWWHRKWERLPVVFTILVVVAVAIASLFEIIPTFLIRSNIPTIASVKPYTPLELAGRDIYIAEGCYNCHSQQIRPIIPEVKRYGEYSKAGEFVYDHPFQWGSRRIGPDLAREGGKQNDHWHLLHFRKPSDVTSGSIMPTYGYLETEKADFNSIPLRVKAMMTLGVPYTELDRAEALANAQKQAAAIAANIAEQAKDPKLAESLKDKEVVALIAYLQRIGKDLSAPTPAPSGAPAPAAVPAKAAASILGGN